MFQLPRSVGYIPCYKRAALVTLHMCGFVDLNNNASNCISCSFRAISRSQTSSVNEYWLSRAKALVLLVKHRNSFCSQLSERAESSLIHRYQVSKQTLQGIMCTRKECWDRPSLMSLSFLGRMCCLVEYFQGLMSLWSVRLSSSITSFICLYIITCHKLLPATAQFFVNTPVS